MVTPDAGVYAPQTFFGLSTDTKPIGVPNGSDFVEMDTSKWYFFDAENQEWVGE